ncbi:protein phosphatase 2C domain-containing protein [Thermogemmatispora onikobensis]|uniref:protein phosphatase 2C domain-containing protein n=1 Tax=Thermogemmatispora onikobensis TaxID=732234 RepID=UPI00085388B7|nr:protein phosphatase 2C domain-containing protein [Thermogemmatispora onikobensis]
MSTYHLCSAERKNIGLLSTRIGLLLGALLIALQLLWPVAAVAAPGGGSVDVGKSQVLDLVGAAVVRLLVTYTSDHASGGQLPLTRTSVGSELSDEPAPLSPPDVQCTGLGVLVRSWQPRGANDLNAWVLTDGDLVSRLRLCGNSGSLPGQLTSIDIYSSSTGLGTLLTRIACAGLPLSCSNRGPLFPEGGSSCPIALDNCAHTLVLVPFHSAYALPSADLASLSSGEQTTTFGLELTDASGALPAQASQAPNFLTPELIGGQERPVNTATSTPGEPQEGGTPIVNQAGQVVGLQLLSGEASDASQVRALLNSFNLLEAPANPLLAHWRAGIQDYYRGQYQQAKGEFQQTLTLSQNQLRGAQQFLQLINQRLQTPTSSQAQPQGAGSEVGFAGLPLLVWGGIVGLLLLVVILLLITLTVGRVKRRKELERFRKEEEEAKRQADLEAERQRQRVRTLQAQPQPQAAVPAARPQQSQLEREERAVASASTAGAAALLQCPRCKQQVSRGVEYCPSCGVLLSPSTSGLRLRALVPPEAAAPQPAAPMPGTEAPTENEMPAAAFSTSPSPAQSASVTPLSDQPTFVLPPLSDQPTQAIAAPAASRSEGKTQVIRGRQRMKSLQLVVGHRTDPGIKRRHKPNEDSLLAILGGRQLGGGQVQPWGLFVVADGMGGHANGQDASRLAIQTIVDYVLPSLLRGHELSSNDYQRLLVEGVQSANQAVHEQNQREHADMGTTMTTALIVGSVAYVANVGDSRTYLYREGGGLKKVTQDHSVVASLVEAGIIKPEDIYTHPKRNQIYRSLGEKPIVEVDPFREELLPGDKLLLCSDGLWDMTRDPYIESVLRKSADPQQLVNDLVQLALDGGGEDNISVIVVQLVESTRAKGSTVLQVLAQPDQFALPTLPQS